MTPEKLKQAENLNEQIKCVEAVQKILVNCLVSKTIIHVDGKSSYVPKELAYIFHNAAVDYKAKIEEEFQGL